MRPTAIADPPFQASNFKAQVPNMEFRLHPERKKLVHRLGISRNGHRSPAPDQLHRTMISVDGLNSGQPARKDVVSVWT
jgi:hypothetical protein